MKIKKRKKRVLLIVTLFSALIILFSALFLTSCQKSGISNDEAHQDTNGRYLTIINNTDQIINEVHVYVGIGTEIEKARLLNPDNSSFTVEIPKEYSDYSDFKIVLIDRYEIMYEKEITDIPQKGVFEVAISNENYKAQDGDTKKKIDRFFNGD